MNEPTHPTYGTLDQFLGELKQEIKAGYDLRIGMQGAINWFIHAYAERKETE